MSDNFKVPYTKILEILPHPKAEVHSLEVAKVYDYFVIVRKGTYNVGDKVLYAPIDSIITPELEEVLFGKDAKIKLLKRRIKQTKIQGFYSQGMIINPSLTKLNLNDSLLESDFSEALGIVKYEPPTPSFQRPAGPRLRNKPFTNPYFRCFNGITNIKWAPYAFKDEEVVIQEKVHGCIRNYEEIQLTDGSKKTIQEIVDNKLEVSVWGYDEQLKKIVPSKILGWANHGSSDKWLKVKYTKVGVSKGSSYRTLETTPNHLFYLPEIKDYRRADELKPGMKVLFKRDDIELTYIQEQILIGKMLGDGSQNRNHMTFGQSKSQEEYLDYTLKSLGYVAGNRMKNQFSGYGTEMVKGRTISLNSIKELFSDWFIDNKKQVPASIINNLSPISLAFWYMDDGSLGHNDSQQDRTNFAVCGFNENSIDNLLLALKKFNINGIKYQTKNKDNVLYWRIRLNCDEADKMFLLIAPYIVKSLRYKLPERYRDFPFVDLPFYENKYKSILVEQKILSIEDCSGEYSNKRNNNKYDIETETSNFFINGILVHNSHIRFGKAPFVANTFWKKILKFLNLQPKFECVYGSNNVELTNRIRKSSFYGGDIYGDVIKKFNEFDKIKNGEFVHGEIIGPGIQKGYSYGHTEHHLVIFDVRVMQEDGSQKWLNPEEVEAYAKERGFTFVPVLYKGVFSKEIVEECTKGPSIYCPKERVREGCVVKSRFNYDDNSNKRAYKSINPKYLELDPSDNH